MAESLVPAPKVSIIIPTYKHRDWVIETLNSVLAQTFSDYEILLINDGSPDDTASVVAPLVKRHGNVIRYFEQQNAGQANARNFGISHARGEFIALLDDDDLWPEDKLAWQVDVLRGDPDVVMVYGGMQLIDSAHAADTGKLDPGPDAPTGQIREQLLRRNRIWSPGQTLIRASALSRIGGLDETIWGADDWDLYIRLAALGRIEFRYRLALRYRKHAGNASQNAIRMYLSQCRVFRKHMGMAIWKDRDVRREWRGASAGNCLAILDQALDRRSKGQYGAAWSACLLALAIKPSLLKSRFFWKQRFAPLWTGRVSS